MKIREGYVSNSSSSSFILSDDIARDVAKAMLREERRKKLKHIEKSIENENTEGICE